MTDLDLIKENMTDKGGKVRQSRLSRVRREISSTEFPPKHRNEGSRKVRVPKSKQSIRPSRLRGATRHPPNSRHQLGSVRQPARSLKPVQHLRGAGSHLAHQPMTTTNLNLYPHQHRPSLSQDPPRQHRLRQRMTRSTSSWRTQALVQHLRPNLLPPSSRHYPPKNYRLSRPLLRATKFLRAATSKQR